MQAEKQAMVAALSARKAQLASDLARLTSTQTSDPGIVSEQAQLSRNYEVLKDQYDKLLADRDDVRLRGDVQSETDAIKRSEARRVGKEWVSTCSSRWSRNHYKKKKQKTNKK